MILHRLRLIFVFYLFFLTFSLVTVWQVDCESGMNGEYSKVGKLNAHIGILPVVNVEKTTELEAISNTITDTVELTLKLMGRYVVERLPRKSPYEHPSEILKLVKKLRLDNVIFGRVKMEKNGTVVIELSVYDRSKDKVTITKVEKAETLFDIFDVSDTVILSLVNKFSGIHVGFGSLELINKGEDGEFKVYIDGAFLGNNKYTFDRVLNGEHLVEIRQDRMFGEERIFEKKVTILEDESVTVEFSIPYLTKREQVEIKRLKSIINNNWTDRESISKVSRAIEKALGYLSETPYCNALHKEYEFFQDISLKYKIKITRWSIDSSVFDVNVHAAVDRMDDLARLLESKKLLEKYSGELGVGTDLVAEIISLSVGHRFLGLLTSHNLTFRKGLENKDSFAILDDYDYGKKIGWFANRDYIEDLTLEKEAAEGLLNEYRFVRNKGGHYLLPIFSIGAGIAAGAASGWLFYDDPAPGLVEEGNALYEQYRVSEDSDELKSLHERILWNFTLANLYEWVKWGGTVAAPVLTGLGIYSIVKNITTPARFLQDSARLLYGNGIRAKGKGWEDSFIVLTKPLGSEVFINNRLYGHSPVVIGGDTLKKLKEIGNVDIRVRDFHKKVTDVRVDINKERYVFIENAKIRRIGEEEIWYVSCNRRSGGNSTRGGTFEIFWRDWGELLGRPVEYALQYGKKGREFVETQRTVFHIKGTKYRLKLSGNPEEYVFRIWVVDKSGVGIACSKFYSFVEKAHRGSSKSGSVNQKLLSNPLFFMVAGGPFMWKESDSSMAAILGFYGMGFRVYREVSLGVTGGILSSPSLESTIMLPPIIPTCVFKASDKFSHLFHFVYLPPSIYGRNFYIFSYGVVVKNFLMDLWIQTAEFQAWGIGFNIGFVF